MPALKVPRSDVVSEDLYQPCREAEEEYDLAAKEVDGQGGDIGGHIDDLAYAVGLFDVEVDEVSQGYHQKGSHAGAVEAVIDAEEKGYGYGEENLLFFAQTFPLLCQIALSQEVEAGQGNDDEHDELKDLVTDHQGDSRSYGRTRKTEDEAVEAEF